MDMKVTLQPEVRNRAGVMRPVCDIDVKLTIDLYRQQKSVPILHWVEVEISNLGENGIRTDEYVNAPEWVWNLAREWFDTNYEDVCTRYREYLADEK